ncbi:MAG: hypothetical protein ACP6IS_06570 [Candidatus Asgardarchaeia archaeon]
MEIDTFMKGYKKIADRLKDMITNEDWNYFGIIDYDYTEIEDKLVVTPESLMVALANHYNKTWNKNVLVILNFKRKGKYSLHNSEQLYAIRKIVEENKERMTLLELSYNDLGIGEKIRVNVGNVIELQDILAQALAKISERTNYVNPKKIKFSTVESFTKFLQKISGPPSILDDLKKRAQDYVGSVGGPKKFIARMVSVTKLIETALIAVAGFYKVLKLHLKDEEYKAWLEKLKTESKEIYSIEKMQKIFSEEYPTFHNGVNIVVTDLFDRYYGFVIGLLILDFLKTNPSSLVVIGDMPVPEYYEAIATWIPKITSTYEVKLGAYIATKYYPTTDQYTRFLKNFFSEKSIIFNLKSDFFHAIHTGESIIVYSWLYEKFSQIEEEKLDGEYLFIFHDEKRELPWMLMSLEKGTLERLKGFFRK